MASALIVPGVQVTTEFEPAPVLPGATGILGFVGVADGGPLLPTPVGSFGEFTAIFGAASRYTMPEARTAFADGVMEIVVARIEPGRCSTTTANRSRSWRHAPRARGDRNSPCASPRPRRWAAPA